MPTFNPYNFTGVDPSLIQQYQQPTSSPQYVAPQQANPVFGIPSLYPEQPYNNAIPNAGPTPYVQLPGGYTPNFGGYNPAINTPAPNWNMNNQFTMPEMAFNPTFNMPSSPQAAPSYSNAYSNAYTNTYAAPDINISTPGYTGPTQSDIQQMITASNQGRLTEDQVRSIFAEQQAATRDTRTADRDAGTADEESTFLDNPTIRPEEFPSWIHWPGDAQQVPEGETSRPESPIGKTQPLWQLPGDIPTPIAPSMVDQATIAGVPQQQYTPYSIYQPSIRGYDTPGAFQGDQRLATEILNRSVAGDEFTPEEIGRWDLNGDGTVDSGDAILAGQGGQPGRYGIGQYQTKGYDVPPSWQVPGMDLPGQIQPGGYNIPGYDTSGAGYDVGGYQTPTYGLTDYQSTGYARPEGYGLTDYNLPGAPQVPGYETLRTQPTQGYQIPGAQWGGQYQLPGQINRPSFGLTDYDVPQLDPTQYDLPDMPTVPEIGEVGYDVPDAAGMMPTEDWMQNFSPEIMAGLNAPYDKARAQMLEEMGASGQAGSAGAGLSGAAGAALGEFEANRANQIGLQAWNMLQPAMAQEWSAQLGANQFGAQAMKEAEQWKAAAGLGTQQRGFEAGVEQAKYGASQQAEANRWNATAEAARAERFADIGMTQGQWEANTELALSKWESENELDRSKRLSDIGVSQEQWKGMSQLEQNRFIATSELQNQQRYSDVENARRQWQAGAQLGVNEFMAAAELAKNERFADIGLSQNQWMAYEELASNKYDAENANDRAKRLAEIGLEKSQYDAATETEQNRWLAASELQRDQIKSAEEMGLEKWKAQGTLERDQWQTQAQLAIDNKWADMEMTQEMWTAQEQAASNRWETMSELDQVKRLADIGLEKNKFDAMNENDRSKYVTAASLAEQTRVAEQQTQQNQLVAQTVNQMRQQYAMQENQRRQMEADYANMQAQQFRGEQQQERQQDYQNILAQQDRQYGFDSAKWQAGLEEARFPWVSLPGMLGGTYSSPVINPGSQGLGQQLLSTGANAGALLGLAKLFSLASSRRYKKNITHLGYINGQRLVSFEYKSAPGKRVGFIAEEVAVTRPDAVKFDKYGRPDAVYYGLLL